MMAQPLGFRVSGAFGTKAPIKYSEGVIVFRESKNMRTARAHKIVRGVTT